MSGKLIWHPHIFFCPSPALSPAFPASVIPDILSLLPTSPAARTKVLFFDLSLENTSHEEPSGLNLASFKLAIQSCVHDPLGQNVNGFRGYQKKPSGHRSVSQTDFDLITKYVTRRWTKTVCARCESVSGRKIKLEFTLLFNWYPFIWRRDRTNERTNEDGASGSTPRFEKVSQTP